MAKRGGEANAPDRHDEAGPARDAQTDCGANDLLGQALARENMAAAWRRVKANKGSAGVDGRTVQDTDEYLKDAWPEIRQLASGCSMAPTSQNRCAGWAYRNRMGERANWASRP